MMSLLRRTEARTPCSASRLWGGTRRGAASAAAAGVTRGPSIRAPLPPIPAGWLFRHHADGDLGNDLRPEPHLDLVIAQLLDLRGELDELAVHRDPRLPERLGDVARGDRAEELPFLARPGREGEGDRGDLLREGLGRLPGLLRPGLDDPLVVLQGPDVPDVGRDGELLRDQEVAAVPVGDLDDVAGLPQLLHVFAQDDLHRAPP